MRAGPRLRRRPAAAALLLSLLGTLLAGAAVAGVHHSRESALRLAFGEVDSVEARTIFLDESERARIEERAGSALPGLLHSAQVAWRDGREVGYAFFDTHPVRSLPETLLVVIEPDGRLRAVHLVAFHEPPGYAPPAGWLDRLRGRSLDARLSLRGEVAPLAGSTLSAQAVTAAVRRSLALWAERLGPHPPTPTR